MITKYKDYRKASVLYLNRFLEERLANIEGKDIRERVKMYCAFQSIEYSKIGNLYKFLEVQFLKSKKPTKELTKKVFSKKEKAQRRKEYQDYLHSAAWKNKRQYILETRNCTCERCGDMPELYLLHVHHKTYARIFNELPEDLELLCKPCHKKEHKRKPIKRKSKRT